MIQARLDIALQDPLGRLAFVQHRKALFYRLRCGSLFPKARGMRIPEGFCDRLQRLPIQGLHGPVDHTRMDSWAMPFPLVLGNPSPPHRLRTVALLPQLANRWGLLLWALPEKAIHSRRPFAWVIRHPFDGQGVGRERVGQQVLESLLLPPSASLHCLHDTRVEPMHVPVDCGPVHGMPIHRRAGDYTSCRNCCHLPCLLTRFAMYSREERPEGGRPAFAWGAVAEAQPLSAPLQDDVRLLPPPVPAMRWARLPACFPAWAHDGLPTLRIHAKMG
jgi:hypothetical protein